jgi:hypothetical protein
MSCRNFENEKTIAKILTSEILYNLNIETIVIQSMLIQNIRRQMKCIEAKIHISAFKKNGFYLIIKLYRKYNIIKQNKFIIRERFRDSHKNELINDHSTCERNQRNQNLQGLAIDSVRSGLHLQH